MNIDEIRHFISNENPTSKIYLGCDSTTYLKKNQSWTNFCTVLVVHKNCCNGCKIFGDIVSEKDYTQNKKKPLYRLMREVHKVAEFYLTLSDVIADRDVEIHLDINPDTKHTSSIIIDQAIGYIRGACNVTPIVKPNAWCATHAADRFPRIYANKF